MSGISKYTEMKIRLETRPMTAFDKHLVADIDRVILRRMTDSQISVDVVATELFMSPAKLRRLLQNATGFTPALYIMFVRMREAVQQLKMYPLHTIAFVAQRCGFTDQAHFTHAFKRIFSITPSEYTKA